MKLFSNITSRRRHRGLTLVELLIVVVILGILVAAVIPLLAPSTNARRIREASRGLNTFISLARAKAIGSGKPYGILLKKLSRDTESAADRTVCLEVFVVEQPNPYTGFSDGSAVQFSVANNVVQFRFVMAGGDPVSGLPPGWSPDLFPNDLIRPGDIIEIGDQRFFFTDPATSPSGAYAGGTGVLLNGQPIDDTGTVFDPKYDTNGARLITELRSANAPLQAISPNDSSQRIPAESPFWTEPRPYRIIRQPILTSTPPFQLPEGSAIDLQASGFAGDAPFVVEPNEANFNRDPSFAGIRFNDDPITIMFSPEGGIEAVRYNRGGAGNNRDAQQIRAVNNLHLLVSSRENTPVDNSIAPTASETETSLEEKKSQVNWLNLESRWVTIGGQSGNISTAENAFVDPIAAANDAVDYDSSRAVDSLDIRREQLRRARAFAREGNREGGT